MLRELAQDVSPGVSGSGVGEGGAASSGDVPAGGGLKAHLVAARGWSSPLAIMVTAALVAQTITGLWIYLAWFSLGLQLQLLLHTGVGLLLIGPYLWYQFGHWRVWWQQKLTAVMMLGYVLMVMVLGCVVSGLVLTWQAYQGPRISPGWDIVHLVSGIGTGILVVIHLLLAFVRRRPLVRTTPELRLGVRRMGQGTLGGGVGLVGVLLATGELWPVGAVRFPVPENYSLSSHISQYEEYRGSPFAPSNARTDDGMLIDPEVLSNSASCGTSGCHEEIYAEWLPSAHRFSAMNAPFQAVQKSFAADREPAETRYCAGCHDPISLFAGAKDIHNLSLSAPGMQEGCSCVVCHAIDQVDRRGNADYVLVPPQRYLWETSTGWKKAVSDFLIRAYPRQHLADYDRPLLRSPEFCGACHKQFIPEALNRFGLVSGQNQYDEWRQSHWHSDDPDTNLTCVDCHMRLVHDSTDPGRGEAGAVRRSADDGAHRHHGTIATNFLMPKALKLPHWEEQVKLTEEWIRGETVIPEIAHLWPEGPVASLEVIAPERIRAGETLQLRAIVVNRKAGHNLTTGPLDFMRCWIHLRVEDAAGQVVAEWGGLDPATRHITDVPGQIHEVGNSRKEGTLVLEGMPIDATGEIIRKHELWNQAGGKGKRVIFPKYSDSHSYSWEVPADVQGPLVIRADLNYCRYRQEFLDLVLPELEEEMGEYQPIVSKASWSGRVAVDPSQAVDVSQEAGRGADPLAGSAE